VPQIGDLTTFLRTFAPLPLAEHWDNTGLLIGDEQKPVTAAMTCLSLTADVAAEAIEQRAGLIVTHHPILFRPIQRLTRDTPEGSLLLDLIASEIAIYSPHTSYDSAQHGINQQLAELMGLAGIGVMRRRPSPDRCKLVTFVPAGQLERVQDALWSAGAGRIKEYSKCSFYVGGTGTFFGSEATNPAAGRAGRLEHVDELRLEVVCFKHDVPAVTAALRFSHPYEEPAFDIYPLESEPDFSGAGRWGDLPTPVPLAEFNQLVKSRLSVDRLQFVGEESRKIARVAIACGSAAEFIGDAVRLHCDLLLTGEARFHACLEARTRGIALVLPGHYATERPAMERLAAIVSARFPDVRVWPSRVERDPLNWT